jgi:hypothetical protein
MTPSVPTSVDFVLPPRFRERHSPSASTSFILAALWALHIDPFFTDGGDDCRGGRVKSEAWQAVRTQWVGQARRRCCIWWSRRQRCRYSSGRSPGQAREDADGTYATRRIQHIHGVLLGHPIGLDVDTASGTDITIFHAGSDSASECLLGDLWRYTVHPLCRRFTASAEPSAAAGMRLSQGNLPSHHPPLAESQLRAPFSEPEPRSVGQ